MNALVNLEAGGQPNYNLLNPVLQLKHPYWLVGKKISVVHIGIGPHNNWHISFTASKIFALAASTALLMSILPSSSLIRAIVSLPTFLVVFPLSNIIIERILGMPSIVSFIVSLGIGFSYLAISNSAPLPFRIALVAIPCLFSACCAVIGLKISGFPDSYMKKSVMKDILGKENYQHMMQDILQVQHYSWEIEEIEKIDYDFWSKKKPFFIELKDTSNVLAFPFTEAIDNNLEQNVYLFGFSKLDTSDKNWIVEKISETSGEKQKISIHVLEELFRDLAQQLKIIANQ